MSLLDRVLGELSRRGLLLKQDKRLPNVVGLVTGESLSTSWWGHPEGGRIFGVLEELDDHADVVCTKLLSGKDTFVHRRLWPSLLAVAAAREPWQQHGLTPGARRLLASVDAGSEPIRASGPAVRELERRLLVRAGQVHTESGRHAVVLEPWTRWARRVRCSRARSVSPARRDLEEAARDLGAAPSALPWPTHGEDDGEERPRDIVSRRWAKATRRPRSPSKA